ncbi:hypothetical protein STAN_0031 [Streptomyces sp. CBMAI 2042]|nr:hypothetical protein STAN_0031 [Streptomyces sp. CBMAI 2042]
MRCSAARGDLSRITARSRLKLTR